jgi:hypothetical protein
MIDLFALCRSSAQGFFIFLYVSSLEKGIVMPQDGHAAQTSPCEPSEEAIRKNLHGLLRLLAREVAQRLARKTDNRAEQSERPAKEHPPLRHEPGGRLALRADEY